MRVYPVLIRLPATALALAACACSSVGPSTVPRDRIDYATAIGDPEIAAKSREIRSILGLKPDLKELRVYYGGYSGKNDEIDMMTRSMLQIMLELAAVVQVPTSDVVDGKAAPGAIRDQASETPASVALQIVSGDAPPPEAYVAVPYKGRWLWIADTDIRSKYTFGFVMLLFSISETGVHGAAPVVTVPASQ